MKAHKGGNPGLEASMQRAETVLLGPWLIAGWRMGVLQGFVFPPEDQIPPGC